MLKQASDIAVIVYLVVGVVAFAAVALSFLICGARDAFQPCYTIRPDGTPSEAVDSFHVRTWVMGLAVPSYRATAMRGLGRIVAYVVLAVTAGCVAVLLGMGIC